MANRDKSQAVGFVYTNIYELYKKAQNAAPHLKSELKSDQRVWRADELAGIKITKFEPRNLNAQAQAPAAKLATSTVPGASPIEDLKANMARLQEMHSKLRFMIKELEDLVNKK